MEIQPVVLGTAGHIDHGKSTLVRALTGIDPDRLKEERERGLTIDLGFANLELPDGRRVGIVDVPGHERFIRNMAAGASGIDLVILVVAADDGVMPQTREHLQIMELLGVQRGFVALTKVDAVDEELTEMAAADVEDFLAGTFLGGAPILRVSALTGAGMDELRALLCSMASECPSRSTEGVFRMPVQRVFSARGFGTIATGIPVAGEVKVGQMLELLPAGTRGKLRGIQAYGEKVERARAGHSTALNIADIDHQAVSRGDLVAAPGFFKPVRMVGARLTALPALGRAITDRMPIRLHTGTADPPGEVVLLDCAQLEPGASGLVQLRLEDPIVVAPGDRFVLRQLSPVVTLGGGVILEESRYRLKRFKGFVIDGLERQEGSLGSPEELLESALARAASQPMSSSELAVSVKRERTQVEQLLEELSGRGRVVLLGRGGKGAGWMHIERLEEALEGVLAEVDAWFVEQPHRGLMDLRELRSRVALEPAVLGHVLDHAAASSRVELASGGRLRPAGRVPELSAEESRLADALAGELEASTHEPPAVQALTERHGSGVPRLLETLADEGRVARVAPELYFSALALERARSEVVANCRRNGQLEIPELRDALGTTRKFLIPLLEHLDAEGVTIRQGGHRVLKSR